VEEDLSRGQDYLFALKTGGQRGFRFLQTLAAMLRISRIGAKPTQFRFMVVSGRVTTDDTQAWKER